MTNFYTTGGTLPPNAPSYIPRQADNDLYHALKQGEFCYILNSRQMGKSSLTIRVANRLRDDGIIVVVFELSSLGTQLTIEQWYDGLMLKIGQQLNLSDELDDFWYDNDNLGFAQRLEQAFRRVVLGHYQQPVVICFDEIDSVRSLPFATDDFFATIRCCYNERAQNPDLQRLTFCLVGTARPTDLMTDAQATPFDIGQAIELTGFTFEEARPLAQGLQGKADNPEAVLGAILEWTGGQPFLTQKVCDLFWRHTDTPLASGQETAYVEQVIQTHIIEHWESKDDPPHLTTIRNRLIERDNRQYTWQLLGLCRYILALSQPEEMREAHEMELRLTGLMVKQPGGQLRVFNKIYEQVFNQHWLAQAQCETLADNPYLGLSAFQAEDAQRFFGRTQLTAKFLEKCRDLEAAQLPRLLPILGPSGSGKSSVARAGLIPALQRSLKNVHVEIFTPTDAPLKELARIVASIQSIDSIEKREQIEQLLRTQKETLLNQILITPLVLLIDQFEEVYTLCENAADGTAFIDNLITAVQSKRGLLVILTLRSDFLGATQRHGLLNQIIARQAVIVPMMSEAELREAIAKPAEQAGHALDLATVDLLVEQAAGREGALPLLQFALMDLWAGLRKGVEPSETLRQIGGVGGALAGKAEDIYQGLSAAKKRVARRAFLKLIQLGEGTKDTRRRVKMRDLVAHGENENIVHAILSRFAQPDARLVTLSKDKQDHKTAEVTHEALLENWQTLKDWLADSREDLRFEHRLNDAINNWQRQQHADGLLWRSPDLDLLGQFYQQHRQNMNRLQIKFFKASLTAKRKAEQRERQFIEEQQRLREEAEQQQNQALRTQSLFLADLARQEIENGNATNGILLALEALPKDMSASDERPYIIEAKEKLLEAISNHREYLEYLVLQNNEPIHDAVFSPDGKKIVTVGNNGSVRIWDAQSGQLLIGLEGQMVTNAAFSPDGQHIVTASNDKTACLWDAQSGQLLKVLKGHESEVNNAVFSLDGQRIVTASKDKTARLWNAQSGQLLHVLKGHKGWVTNVAFSPNDQYIVTVSYDNTACLWPRQSMTYRELVLKVLWSHNVMVHKAIVTNAAFSPDGQCIVTVSGYTACLWDTQSRQLFKALSGHQSDVNNAVFSPDGQRIVTASNDKTARLWDTQSGQLLKVLKGHESEVNNALFSPDSQRIVTASNDKTARLWDAQSGQLLKVLSGHESEVNNAVFSPDGQRIVTTSYDHTARLWDAQSGQLFKMLEGHQHDVNDAAFSPDGQRIVTVSRDKTACLWDAQSGQLLKVLSGHKHDVNNAAFSPDGQRIVTASKDKIARLWNAQNGQLLKRLSGHKGWVNNAVFSPDGQRIVTASNDKTARLLYAGGQLLKVLEGHKDRVKNAEFSPDSQRIVTVSGDTAPLWDANNGSLLTVLQGHEDHVNNASFSPDGQRIVTASYDNTARLWNAQSGLLIKVLEGHERGVNNASFSPDSQRIVTASYDKTARLWNAQSGLLLSVLEGHEGWINYAAFSPDGKQVITTSHDGTARLWRVFPTTQDLIDYANQIVSRCLTPEQRKQFFLPPEPSYDLIEEGEKLAKQGDIKAATAKFKEAKTIAPCHKFLNYPEEKAREIAAMFLIEKGKALAKKGQMEVAVEQFKQAQKIDGRFKFGDIEDYAKSFEQDLTD